jgi:hypothetical protein
VVVASGALWDKGSLHLLVAAWTEFRSDGPGSPDHGAHTLALSGSSERTPAGPLDPLARFKLLGLLLNGFRLAVLLGIEIAQGVGEPACVGDLVLFGSRDVLHPIRRIM